MWKSVLSYALSSSNYGVANMNNIYNFILSILDIVETDEKKEEIMDSLILHLGKTFYKDFRAYVITKVPKSKHLPVINRII
jgi:hypothetical protein